MHIYNFLSNKIFLRDRSPKNKNVVITYSPSISKPVFSITE